MLFSCRVVCYVVVSNVSCACPIIIAVVHDDDSDDDNEDDADGDGDDDDDASLPACLPACLPSCFSVSVVAAHLASCLPA